MTVNDKISIHIFIPSLRGGGAERVGLNLAKGLNREVFRPSLILAEKTGPYLAQVPADVSIISLAVPHVRQALPKLVHHLRQKHPDILFSVMSHTNIIALLARKFSKIRTKVIVSVHSRPLKPLRQTRFLEKRMFIHLLERWLYPKADRIIAVSEGLKDDMLNYLRVGGEKITVIHNPIVDEGIFALAQEPVDHPWFRDKSVPIILAVGRLAKPKDYPTLLRAFKLIRSRLATRLVVLGEGEERARLESLARELGIENDVALLGFQENPYKFMAKASVFVLSSLWEGFGNVLVEAMACGAPVVATNCPFGPSEIITPGANGLLVPPADPETLAEAILKILRNKELAVKLAEAGHKRARDFEIGKILKEYEKLFTSMMMN